MARTEAVAPVSPGKKAGTKPGGQPQALTVIDGGRVLAAAQDGVHESLDGGRTFAERLPVSSVGGH